MTSSHHDVNASLRGEVPRSWTGRSLLDSIVLQETRQSCIGNPMVMFLGPDSSLYVIDSFGQSVLRFDRTGQQIRRYGRAGEGPGEFVSAGRAGFASRTVLGVTDGRSSGPPGMAPNQVVEFFDTESGEHVGSVRTTNVSFLASQGGIIWLAGIDVGTWRTLTTRELSPLWRGAREGRGAGTVVSMDRVPVPSSYRESSLVRGLGGFVRMHVVTRMRLWGSRRFLSCCVLPPRGRYEIRFRCGRGCGRR